MKKNILITAALFTAGLLSAQSFTQYVDPRIGTGDHGHVFLGANVPFGMVNAGPTQIESGWDWCSGYHESGTKIVGFAQTHLSGTGCSDLGDIAIMPAVKELGLSREGLATTFSHEKEEVRPGYYSIVLPETGIRTEITATQRSAMYRITYPEGAHRHLYVDLENGVDDELLWGRLQQIDPYTYVGYRVSHGWSNVQHCYFVMRLSQKSRIYEQATMKSKRGEGPAPIYHLQVMSSSEPLLVNIALSPVSEANAIANLKAEVYKGGELIDFDTVRTAADAAWNRELGRVQATFLSDRDRTIFYTAMYHFMVAPQTWDDANGDWRGADNKIYRSTASTAPELCSLVIEGRYEEPQKSTLESPVGTSNYLTTLSLWDTYRAAAPLSTIILPEMMPAIATTYLRIFREQGKLPVWHLMSQETNCMVGCPAVPILADLLLKGFVADSLAAWDAMYKSLNMDERGLDDMKRYGYVTNDHQGESVSRTLEYMLADWAAVQAGKAILKSHADNEEVRKGTEYLDKRSHGYPMLYDKRVNFFRGKNSDGSFESLEGFNPNHQTRPFTEGNPWQYLWLVPHDVEGLMQMLGGREIAVKRLDSLFIADSQLNENAQPDITGLIGQYAHGNEPSHHVAYMYALMGQPRKTAKIVHQIQRELYTDQPAGLCGNEDVGQMSGWYILSALGFYQVEPCGGRYVLGSPLVKEATIHVGGGKTFTIRTHDLSEKAFYIKRVLLNGQPLPACTAFSSCTEKLPKGYSAPFILRHEDIVQGGTLDIFMSK